MGISSTKFLSRVDTLCHFLHYPQKPLVTTKVSELLNLNELPAGQNIIVAIACYTGYNQEDSLIMNQSSIDRGLFNSTFYRTYRTEERKNLSTMAEEKFCRPDQSDCSGLRHGSYENLNKNGLVKIGTKVGGDDVIIGKKTPIMNIPSRSKKNLSYKDNSTSLRSNESGIVDRVILTTNTDGYRLAKVRIRSHRIPEIGDKFSCYDDKTSILTNNGFKLFKDFDIKYDKVATLVNKESIKYVKPTKYFEYDVHNEDMYLLESRFVNICVTMNHKMYVKMRKSKDKSFKLQKAEDIVGKDRTHKRGAENGLLNSKYIKYFRIPKDNENEVDLIQNKFKVIKKDGKLYDDEDRRVFPMDSWLKFISMIICDGHVPKNNSIALIISASKSRKLKLLNEIINELNIDIVSTENHSSYKSIYHRIWDKDIRYYFMNNYCEKAQNKYLPDYVFNLNKEQSRLLLEYMIKFDGSLETGKNGTSRGLRFSTSSVKLRDNMMILALHAGLSGSYSLSKKKGHEQKIGKNTFKLNFDAWRVNIAPTKNEVCVNGSRKNEHDKIIKYTGKVYCVEAPPSHVVYVRRNGKGMWCGNSRHGQKGTIGMVYRSEDMPFTEEGITPDIIINPACIPSRMTIGQLLECTLSKIGAIEGEKHDGTPFEDLNIEQICDKFKKYGFNRKGTEVLYNGQTGERIKTEIFIGPTFYQRLKHMVKDKVHSRSTGPVQNLTRQPAEGRSRDGGLRLGEMEVDCLLSHGAAGFLKERIFECSDMYHSYVCNKCGLLATVNPQKNIFLCNSCGNTNDFSKINLPFASKLLWQELYSLGIIPRILTE